LRRYHFISHAFELLRFVLFDAGNCALVFFAVPQFPVDPTLTI
jgi:hypothetical protein